MTTITLNTKAYVGAGILNGLSSWWDRTGGIVSAFQQLTNAVSFTQTKSVVKWKLVAPVVQTDPTACACPGEVLRSTIVDISFRFDKAATKAERDDVLKRIQELVLTDDFAGSVSNLVQGA